MSILEIIQYPDSRLRRKSHKVTDVKSAKIKKIIHDMLNTLVNSENCAALAATQLDIEDPPSIIVIHYPPDDDNEDDDGENRNLLCLINPQIVTKEGKTIGEEGCMSICPNQEVKAEIKRAAKIKVKALNIYGLPIEFEAENFLARCIQHECDHLKGILYIDHLSKKERKIIEKTIVELQTQDKNNQ